jgi:hypothetical protein
MNHKRGSNSRAHCVDLMMTMSMVSYVQSGKDFDNAMRIIWLRRPQIEISSKAFEKDIEWNTKQAERDKRHVDVSTIVEWVDPAGRLPCNQENKAVHSQENKDLVVNV